MTDTQAERARAAKDNLRRGLSALRLELAPVIVDDFATLVWAALQSEREAAAAAARRAALEECAQVMAGLRNLYQAEVGFDTGYRMACERGEKEIRALASPAPQEETR